VTLLALDRLTELEIDVGDLLERSTGAGAVDVSEWWDDPAGFARRIGRSPVDYQADVMRSVARNRFTVWRGCHSCGKEYTAGCVAPWAAAVRGMLVLVISATETQVVGQTMREIAAGFRAVAKEFGLGFDRYQRSIRIGGEDRVIALTGGANVDALTGWHDPAGVLVIISEGQGERLEDVAYDAALANANTELCRVLAMGNPVRPEGRFYEVNRKAHWSVICTSAFDTPNVKAGRTVVPGCPAATWPAEVAAEHGKDSAFYVGRVLAEFPAESEDALVSRDVVEAAVARFAKIEVKHRTPYVLGVDPAGPGEDLFAVTVWHGHETVEYHTWRRLEAPESADRVIEIVRALRRGVVAQFSGSDVRSIYIDEIGIGHGVVGILSRLCRDAEFSTIAVHGVNISKKPGDSKRFVRRKDELVWRLREDLVDGRIALAANDRLVEEICALRVRQTPDGKIEVPPKDQMRAQLGRSPDLLDSLLLGLSPTVPDGGKGFQFSAGSV
jgi:hypothetical protein